MNGSVFGQGGEYLNVPILFPFSVKMLDAGG